MRALQKIYRRGNADCVTIPRRMLMTIGWITGQGVLLEITDDCRALVIRLPNEKDFGPIVTPRIMPSLTEAPK